MGNPHHVNDRSAKWWDNPAQADIPRTVTDEGDSTAEVQNTRQYVWNSVSLAWERMTQPGGGSGGGGAVTVSNGSDVAEGATTDVAVTSDANGTLSGKLRGLVKWAYERMPASLGQKAMAASFPVVLASDQSAVPVTGTFFQGTQPVSGSVSVSNFPATQPISGTVSANQGTAAAVAGAWPIKLVDSAGVNVGTVTAAGAQKVDGSGVTQPVSGTFWQATQPVSGTFWQATQPVSIAAAVTVAQSTAASLAATVTQGPAGASAWKVDGSAVTQPVSIAAAVTVAQATPANLQATVTPIAITKGTQGATGFTTQDLKDAGRVHIAWTAEAKNPGATAEALLTFTESRDGAATTTFTSKVITSGKRLRITSIHFIMENAGSTPILSRGRLRIRVNTAGAVTTASPIQFVTALNVASTVKSVSSTFIDIPDGLEFLGDGTKQIGISVEDPDFVVTTQVPVFYATILAFEY